MDQLNHIVIVMIAFLVASTAIAQAEVLSERSRDVGFGFREVYREETNPPGRWEGVGHFRFLYYKDLNLSQYDSYSISPSGSFAVFQDGPTGNIMVFHARSRTKRILLKFSGSLVKGYLWTSDERQATATLETGRSVVLDIQR